MKKSFIFSKVPRFRCIRKQSLVLCLATLVGYFMLPVPASMQTNYTISGNVKAEGANLSGATVSLSGVQMVSVQTGANGNYSFTVPAGSKYDVSVYKAGFTFNPATQRFTNLQANQIADFQNGMPICAPPPSNLQNWYRAENNANDSTGSDNGILVNGTLYAPGKVGTAFSFDGVDDKVVVPNSPTVNMTGNQLTLAAWIKLSSASTADYTQIFSMADRKYGLYVTTNRNLGFEVNTVNGSSNKEISSIPNDTWVHVALTYNQTVITLYVNGQMVWNQPQTGNMISSSGDLVIGQFATGGYSTFNGLIDEAQIYNRGLSASEIQTIYNAEGAGNCTDAVMPSSTGIPDTSFGTGGKIITPVGNSDDEALSVAIQADGKIVTAGYSSSGSSYDFAVVRYNTDGTLDTSFGTGGKVITPVGNSTDVVTSVAVQADGKIVAAGYRTCLQFNKKSFLL